MDLNHTRLPIPPHLHLIHLSQALVLTLNYYSIEPGNCQRDFEKFLKKRGMGRRG